MTLGRARAKSRELNAQISLRDIIISWDFAVAITAGVAAWMLLPYDLPGNFVKDIYGVGIASLSIIFSVFFASLAIIISSSDDEFVHFLNEVGDYDGIVNTFKFTLVVLFLALIGSTILYISTAAYLATSETYLQPKPFFVGYIALGSYALSAVFLATLDSIHYAKRRGDHVALSKNER